MRDNQRLSGRVAADRTEQNLRVRPASAAVMMRTVGCRVLAVPRGVHCSSGAGEVAGEEVAVCECAIVWWW
ncbi:hypothetical protein [Streptomyces aurantiogriseus]|uniref:hypothetical protein n=1 Tax=Streptomyces aurantiogriseus TaxID=66870 RepID=UPI001672E071|nr:hypothetical protein [Streptomyces aurantiogriseus]